MVTTPSGTHYNLYSQRTYFCKTCTLPQFVAYNYNDRKVVVVPRNITIDKCCMIFNIKTLLNNQGDNRSLRDRIEDKFTKNTLNIITNKCKVIKIAREHSSIMNYLPLLYFPFIFTLFTMVYKCNTKTTSKG